MIILSNKVTFKNLNEGIQTSLSNVSYLTIVNAIKPIIPEATFEEPIEKIDFSARQLEILSYLVKGLSNEEISNQLCITETTVKAHIHCILNKLQIDNRSEIKNNVSSIFSETYK